MAPRAVSVPLIFALERDERGRLRPGRARHLSLVADRLAVRELLERAVEVEASIRDAEAAAGLGGFAALLGRADLEAAAPDLTFSARPPLIAEVLKAFDEGAFVIVFDGRRIERLDETVTVTTKSEVLFVRHLPIRGG